MTIDEKLQHFYEVSLDEAREDAAQAIQEHKEHLARTLEDHKQTSRLNAAGLPLDQIRACLGHSNTTTTLGYIYNPLTPEESLSIMEKAFSS